MVDRQRIKIYGLVSVLATLAVVLTGCGKAAVTQQATEKALENAIEKESGGQAKVDISNDSYKVETKDGNVEIGQNVKLPEGFPGDVYVIDGNIISAFSEPTKENYTVSIQVDKSLSEMMEIYQEKLKDDGWQITGNMAFGDSSTVIAEKGDRTATVMAGKSDDKTSITISTGKK